MTSNHFCKEECRKSVTVINSSELALRGTSKMKKMLVLKGLDHYSTEELNKFWEEVNLKTDSPKILGIGLSCSFKCNLRCIYCYAGPKIPSSDELTLEEQKDILDQAKELGAKTAIICGDGDPLMDNNLMAIVEHGWRNGIIIVVVTNGIILGDDLRSQSIHKKTAKETVLYLHEKGASLIIKIESLNQQRYDKIVGVPGSYLKLMKAINNIKEIGLNRLEEGEFSDVTRLCFSAVIMKHNIHELAVLKDFSDSINAQFVCKVPSLVGDALKNLELMYPVEEYEEIRRLLGKFSAKRETLMVDIPRCMAWHYGPVIDIRGEVRECYTSKCKGERIGNIRENSLKDLVIRRNQIYDIRCNDFCPVKSRINNECLAKGKKKIWTVIKEEEIFKTVNDHLHDQFSKEAEAIKSE